MNKPRQLREPEREYILQSPDEFERLEHQSQLDFTQPERDLGDIVLQPEQRFMDAGCGSGILARYLAMKYPYSVGYGMDMADTTLAKARQSAQKVTNLHLVKDNIITPRTDTGPLHLIYSRYVLQHLSPTDQVQFVRSSYDRLTSGGLLRLIDIDGLFYNIWPRTSFLDWALNKLEKEGTVDLRMGRKLPALLHVGGFRQTRWRVETLGFQGELLQTEAVMGASKIDSAHKYYEGVLGSTDAVHQFKEEYVQALQQPGVVAFVNKFIADGTKP